MRVVLNGVSGKMGSYLYEHLMKSDLYEVVACISRQDLDIVTKVYDNFNTCLKYEDFDTVIDFSIYPNCLDVVKNAILNKKNVVSGTTGYKKYDGQHINYLAKNNQVGVIISPNFSLVDQEFEKFLLQCKKSMPYVFISESHSIHKKDKPSGTATYLGKLLDVREDHIHSIRIPGVIAEHLIIFSDLNQKLEIKHTIHNREVFIKGIEQAIIEVTNNKTINIMI